MSHRHLPAGLGMQGVGGPGSVAAGDMPSGPAQGSGGRRRGPPQHFNHGGGHGHQFHQQAMPAYPAYNMQNMQAYGQFYGGHPHIHPQYQNGAMASPGYGMYPAAAYAARSPPMQQYVPMVGVTVQQNFSPRQSQDSPALATPYQPPIAPSVASVTTPQQPPSSTHSPHNPTPVTSPPPPPSQPAESTQSTSIPASPETQPETSTPAVRAPYRLALPWLSNPDESFPRKAPKKTKRRAKTTFSEESKLEMPVEQHEGSPEPSKPAGDAPKPSTPVPETRQPLVGAPAVAARSETPSTQDQPSECPSTSPTTPNSTRSAATASNISVTPTAATKLAPRHAVPALPIVPVVPRQSSKEVRGASSGAAAEKATEKATEKVTVDGASSPQITTRALPAQPQLENADATTVTDTTDTSAPAAPPAPVLAPAPPPAPLKPKSWASLLSAPGPASAKGAAASPSQAKGPSDGTLAPRRNGAASPFSRASTESLAAALRGFRVGSHERISFIEPRGLTNGGNMCYMNSVLQVLLFCTPFYDFLDQVSQNAAHSFKSETPLIDAMIMFMKEFRVIAQGSSVEQLRENIKGKDKSSGEPLTPNFLYDEMKRSKWFATLEQGHQQDAEEFLGWLLQALDDECSKAMDAGAAGPKDQEGSVSASPSDKEDASDVWMEVGRRQKPSITRSAGSASSSPISKIFGGLLRSELRVPGLKPSITTEPYQPLQLDIGSPTIRNIIDAMKGLTSQEKLQGDFNSTRGKNVEASKQVLIDELPPVLILHLKRFHFDAEGGISKISKKIGYPLELDIPREVLSRQKVASLGSNMPRYRLFAVVYHHGKNAGVGHYTVDVRRQDGSQWIRFDDTKIEVIRAEDVARRGAEEEPAKDSRKDGAGAGASGNRFGGMDGEDNADDDGWKQVPSTNGNKRWSSVVNGNNKTNTRAKLAQEGINDRTVAYILFYQRI